MRLKKLVQKRLGFSDERIHRAVHYTLALKSYGLKRVVKDNFRIEPKIESLEIQN